MPIAPACFWGFPAAISVLIFVLTVFWELPGFNGIGKLLELFFESRPSSLTAVHLIITESIPGDIQLTSLTKTKAHTLIGINRDHSNPFKFPALNPQLRLYDQNRIHWLYSSLSTR